MPSPIVSNDFSSLNYSGSICGRLDALLKISDKLESFFEYFCDSDGVPGTDFVADLVAELRQYIGVPVSAVIWMPAASVPAGYLLCNGQEVSRTTYSDLFQRIGTNYGAGNNSSTFNLPNLTDKFLAGAGGSYGVGTSGGAATVSLTSTQNGPHTHQATVIANNQDAEGSGYITGGSYQSANDGEYALTTEESGTGAAHENLPPYMAGLWLIKY